MEHVIKTFSKTGKKSIFGSFPTESHINHKLILFNFNFMLNHDTTQKVAATEKMIKEKFNSNGLENVLNDYGDKEIGTNRYNSENDFPVDVICGLQLLSDIFYLHIFPFAKVANITPEPYFNGSNWMFGSL